MTLRHLTDAPGLSKALDKTRYWCHELRENWRDRDWRRSRIRHRINGSFQTSVYPKRRGVDIPNEDWDVLVVFDACRADLFDDVIDTRQFHHYRHRTSRASQTKEWLKVNFPPEEEFGDIVYVAGNPMTATQSPRVHRLDETWRDAWRDGLNQIDAEIVTERALRLLEEHPDKRLVVHYMQPHAPFVGHEDLQYIEWQSIDGMGAEQHAQPGARNVWEACANGLVSRDELWAGYRDNLTYAWRHAQRLLRETTDRRTVVTSDHGNVVDARSYPIPVSYSAHPMQHRHPKLVTVPWGVFEAGRPRFKVDETTTPTEESAQGVEKQLAALGYTTGD